PRPGSPGLVCEDALRAFAGRRRSLGASRRWNYNPRRLLEMRHLCWRSPRIVKPLTAPPVAALALASATSADAKGCIKGAVVGGVAGHYAGHHAVIGAVTGCLVGRHEAKRRRELEPQQ